MTSPSGSPTPSPQKSLEEDPNSLDTILKKNEIPDLINFGTHDEIQPSNQQEKISDTLENKKRPEDQEKDILAMDNQIDGILETMKSLEWAKKTLAESRSQVNFVALGTMVSAYDMFEAVKETGKPYDLSSITPSVLLGLSEIQEFPRQKALLEMANEIINTPDPFPEGSAGKHIQSSWTEYTGFLIESFQEMHPQITQTNQQLSQSTNHINSANIGTAMGGYLGSRGKKDGRIGRTIIGMAIGRMLGNTLEGMDIANINSFGEGVSQLGSNVLRGGMETATDIIGGVGDLWSFYKDPSKTSEEKWGTTAGYAALGGLIFMAVKGLGGGFKGLFSSEKKKEKTGKDSSWLKWLALALGSAGLGKLLLGDNWEEKLKGWFPALEGVSDTIGAVLNPAELAKQYLDGQRNKLSEHLATDYPELSKFIQTTHVDVEEANKKLSAMGIEFTEEKYGTKEKAGLALLGSAFLLTAIRHKGVLIAGVGIAGLMAIASYFGLGKEITDPLMGLLESGVEILNDGDKWWQGENNTGGKREYFAKILEKYGQKEVANTVRSLSWENLTEGISYTTGTGFGMMALLAFRKGKFFTGASRAIIGSWIIGREMLDKGDIKDQEKWKKFQEESTAELKELSMGQIIKIYNKHGVQFSAEVFPEEMQAMFTDESFSGVVDDLLKQDFEPEIWDELFAGGALLITLLGAKMLLGGIFSLGKKGSKWKMLAITLLTGYGIGELSEWDHHLIGNFANGTNEVYNNFFAEHIPQMNRNVIEKFLPEWKWVQKIKAEYLGINNYDYILETQKEITDLKTTLSSLKSEHSEHKNFVTQIQRIENLIASEERDSQNPNFLQLPSMEFNILASTAERAGITSHHSGMLETGFTLHIAGKEIKNLPNPPTEKTTSEELDKKRESFIIAGLHQLHKDLFTHLPESKGHNPVKVKAAQTEVKRIQDNVENIGTPGFGEKEAQSIIDSLKTVGVTVEMEKPKDGKVSPDIPQGELIAHFPDGYRMTWGVSPKMDEKTFQEQEKRMGESLLESFIDGHKESYREAIVGASNAMLAVLDIAGIKGEKAEEFRHLLMEMQTNKEFFDSPLAITKLFTRIEDFSFLNIGVSLAENGVIIFSVAGATFASVVKDVVWDTGAELVSQVWKGDLNTHELAYASGLIPTLTFGAGASALYRYGGFTVDPETKKLVPRKGVRRMALRVLSYIPKKAFWELPMKPAEWTKQAIDWRRFNELYNEKTAMNKADAKGNTMRRIKRLALFTDMRREAQAELMVQKYLKLERQKVYIQNKRGTGVRLLRGSEMQKIILKQADLEKQFAKIVSKLPDTKKWDNFKHKKDSLAYHAENDDGVKKLREIRQGKSTSTPKTEAPAPEKPESPKSDSPKAKDKPKTASQETTSENKAPKPDTTEKPKQNIDPEKKSTLQKKSQLANSKKRLAELENQFTNNKANGLGNHPQQKTLGKEIDLLKQKINDIEKPKLQIRDQSFYTGKKLEQEVSRVAKYKNLSIEKTKELQKKMIEISKTKIVEGGSKVLGTAGALWALYTISESETPQEAAVEAATFALLFGGLGAIAGPLGIALAGVIAIANGLSQAHGGPSIHKWMVEYEEKLTKEKRAEGYHDLGEHVKVFDAIDDIWKEYDFGRGNNAFKYFSETKKDLPIKIGFNFRTPFIPISWNDDKDLEKTFYRTKDDIDSWNTHVKEERINLKNKITKAESMIEYYSNMEDGFSTQKFNSTTEEYIWRAKIKKYKEALDALEGQELITENKEWEKQQLNILTEDMTKVSQGLSNTSDAEGNFIQDRGVLFYRILERFLTRLHVLSNIGILTKHDVDESEDLQNIIKTLQYRHGEHLPKTIKHLIETLPRKLFSSREAGVESSTYTHSSM